MALKRRIGLFSAALIVVGGIIGSGIFFTPAATAAALPSAGWVIFVWTLGGAVALAGALTYAELGAMLPEAAARTSTSARRSGRSRPSCRRG